MFVIVVGGVNSKHVGWPLAGAPSGNNTAAAAAAAAALEGDPPRGVPLDVESATCIIPF